MKEIKQAILNLLTPKKWVNVDVYEASGHSYLVQTYGSRIRTRKIGFTNNSITTIRLILMLVESYKGGKV